MGRETPLILPSAMAAESPVQIKVTWDAETGQRRTRQVQKKKKNQKKITKPRRSVAPCLLRVHERFVDPDTQKPFWRISVQRGDHEAVENVPEPKAKIWMRAQVRRGRPEPEFEIDYVGPRMCFHGPPGPQRPVLRYVHWKGFDEPSILLETQLAETET